MSEAWVWGRRAAVGLALTVLFFGLGLGPLLRPVLYTLTPLQRYYLGAYIESSRHASDPEARTGVRWVWKVRPAQAEPAPEPKKKGKRRAGPEPPPKLQYAIAGERDVVPMAAVDTIWNGDALPLLLSAEAGREGWTGLERDYPQQVLSGRLAPDLRRAFFDGEPWWQFFIQPALALGILVCFGLAIRAWLESRRDRHLWGRPLTKREMLWTWMFEPPSQARALPERAAPRQIEASVVPAPNPPPQPQLQPKAKAKAKAEAVPVQAVQQAAQTAPAAVAAQAKAAFVWDESKGID